MFTDMKGRPICLVCRAEVAVTKEYNLRRHYETRHQYKYKDVNIQQKIQKVVELKQSLVSQQTMFVKARPFTEGELKKNCWLKV